MSETIFCQSSATVSTGISPMAHMRHLSILCSAILTYWLFFLQDQPASHKSTKKCCQNNIWNVVDCLKILHFWNTSSGLQNQNAMQPHPSDIHGQNDIFPTIVTSHYHSFYSWFVDTLMTRCSSFHQVRDILELEVGDGREQFSASRNYGLNNMTWMLHKRWENAHSRNMM